MAMVSVNFWRTASVLTVMLVSGCASLTPKGGTDTGSAAPETEVTAAAEEAAKAVGETINLSAEGAPLPRQPYSADGQKLTYEAQPNPYTQGDAAVPPEAVRAFRDAERLMKDEKYRDARKAFWAMTNDFPTLSGPWVKLGEIADLREDPERAEKAFHKALEVNPKNVNGYMALALHQRRKGDFTGAQKTYLDALSVWKDFPGAHLNLAILYDLYLNQPELAQPHYEAYDFLTGGDDPKVGNWLIEVRRRTGIETSFIDIPPPAKPKPEGAEGADGAPAEGVVAEGDVEGGEPADAESVEGEASEGDSSDSAPVAAEESVPETDQADKG